MLVIALALALGGPDAGAKKGPRKRGYRTTVTLVQASSTRFTGTVGSKLGACVGRRLVRLYYTDPITLQTHPLWAQRTGGKGKFEVDLPQPASTGSYHANVDQRTVRAKGAKQNCKAAQGRSIAVVGLPATPP